MPSNPLIDLGTLNRLAASMILTDLPSLNITPSYLGEQMFNLARDGDATTQIKVATGIVTSPQPFYQVTITAELNRASSLAGAWESQQLVNTLLGDITLRTDSTVFPPFFFNNCAIKTTGAMKINGTDVAYGLEIFGTYFINANLWST